MELTDRELAIRWWTRKSNTEKWELLYSLNIYRERISSLTGFEIENIWRKQQTL